MWNTYPPGLRKRAARMVAEVRPEYLSDWPAIKAVAANLGIGSAETLRKWGCRRVTLWRAMPCTRPPHTRSWSSPFRRPEPGLQVEGSAVDHERRHRARGETRAGNY